MDLSRIDLNLLTALDALVEEKNLARAATRLGISQAAMSQALTKMRKLVGDPVLVRAQGKMVPTARAWELHAAIHKILHSIEETLNSPQQFDPKTSRQTFTLASSDYAEFVVLPALVQQLSEVAPSVHIAVRALHGENPLQDLESGRVDLALGELSEVQPGLRKLTLFTERPVAVVRRGHPRARERNGALTPAQVEGLDFVEVIPRSGASFSTVLRDAGMDVHVALRVPSFLVAPMIVAQTDQASVLPERVARHFAEILPIKVAELPVRMDPRAVSLIWRGGEEPESIAWLRNVVSQVGRTL